MSIMAATFNKNEVTEKVYPYVGKWKSNDGYICVLFVSSGSGCVVLNTKESVYEVGQFRMDWLEDNFTPVEATIQFGV